MNNEVAQTQDERAPYSTPQLQLLGASEADGKYVVATMEFTNNYSTFVSGPS